LKEEKKYVYMKEENKVKINIESKNTMKDNAYITSSLSEKGTVLLLTRPINIFRKFFIYQ